MGRAVARGRGQAEIAEEVRRCYELRLAGMTYRQIAATVGLSLATVHSRIETAAAERVVPMVDELRAVESDRLDRLQLALQPGIESGDPRAVSAAVRVSERRARLLGLDAQPGAAEAAVEASLDASGDVVASVLADTIAAVVDVAIDDPVWRGRVEQFGREMAAWCLSGKPDGGRPIAPDRPEPVVVEAEVMGTGRLRPEQRAAMHDPTSPFYRLRTLLDLDEEEVSDADVVDETGA